MDNLSSSWLSNVRDHVLRLPQNHTESSSLSSDTLDRLEAQTPVPEALKSKSSERVKKGRIQVTDEAQVEVLSPPLLERAPQRAPSRKEMIKLRRLAERARTSREVYNSSMPEEYMDNSPPGLTARLDKKEADRRRRKLLTRQLNQLLGRGPQLSFSGSCNGSEEAISPTKHEAQGPDTPQTLREKKILSLLSAVRKGTEQDLAMVEREVDVLTRGAVRSRWKAATMSSAAMPSSVPAPAPSMSAPTPPAVPVPMSPAPITREIRKSI